MIDLVLTCSLDGCPGRVALSAHGSRLDAELSGTCPSCGRTLRLRPAVSSSGRTRRSRRRHGPAERMARTLTCAVSGPRVA